MRFKNSCRSEPQPKNRWQCYGNYDNIQQAQIVKWGIVHGVSPAARKFGISELIARGIIEQPKLKMKNSENFQERIVVWKPFFHSS